MIREAVPSDLEAVASLAARLWPAHAPEDLKPEIAELIAARDAAIFLLFDDDGSPTGFAQCQLRRDPDLERHNNGVTFVLAFHLSAGFSEANRVICFAKRLARP